MNKSKLVIIIVVVVAIAGMAIGFFVQTGLDRLSITSEMKEVAGRYVDLDISPCRVIPEGIDRETASSACLNGILLAYALEHREASPCQDISDSLLKQDCEARVVRMQNLTADQDRFCQGVSLDALCVDLAVTLLASETGEASHCLQIQNEIQRSNCQELISSAGIPQNLPEPPPIELGENGLPIPQFGLLCLKGDEVCENARPKFIEAISSLDSVLCEDTGRFLDLCLNELALYRSFQENDASYCEVRQPKEICAIDLGIARALDAQDPAICETLGGEAAIFTCQNIVESAQGKRFDYLGL